MEKLQIKVASYEDIETKLWPEIDGRIFHFTTSIDNMKNILKDGFIKNNRDGKFEFSYEVSENSYGRNRGCVCVFNLLDAREDIGEKDVILDYLHEFIYHPVYFILKDSIDERLISWKLGKEAWERSKKPLREREVFIPDLEYWAWDKIPVDLVEKIIIVKRKKAKKSPGEKMNERKYKEIEQDFEKNGVITFKQFLTIRSQYEMRAISKKKYKKVTRLPKSEYEKIKKAAEKRGNLIAKEYLRLDTAFKIGDISEEEFDALFI